MVKATSPAYVAESITCGVIMPISDSASHGAAHWEAVKTLIHRSIAKAGMVPHNVWEGAAVDRITSRILSNIFADPIAVCDISDLNPNVMFELGLRLSSKKPTIVVREDGAKIPFDIADFSVLAYPKDLSILRMEQFIEDLSSDLISKIKAVEDKTYEPFLANVKVEVLEPQSQEVSFEQIVSSQLNNILERITSLETKRVPAINRVARSERIGNRTGLVSDYLDTTANGMFIRNLIYELSEPLDFDTIMHIAERPGVEVEDSDPGSRILKVSITADNNNDIAKTMGWLQMKLRGLI